MENKMENEMETGVTRYLSLSRVAYMSGHMKLVQRSERRECQCRRILAYPTPQTDMEPLKKGPAKTTDCA